MNTMTDSDSDYDFESADEGEGLSPKTKVKHHQSTAAGKLCKGTEKGAGDELPAKVEDDKKEGSEAAVKECNETANKDTAAVDDFLAKVEDDEPERSQALGLVKDCNEKANKDKEDSIKTTVRSDKSTEDIGNKGSENNVDTPAPVAPIVNSDKATENDSSNRSAKTVCEQLTTDVSLVLENKTEDGVGVDSQHTSLSEDNDSTKDTDSKVSGSSEAVGKEWASSDERRTNRQLKEKENNLEFTSVLEKMSQSSDSSKTQQSSGWGWGSWGMSVLSTATSSVSTFTSQVGEGLTTVLEGVESTFGAPSPEELAREEAERLKSGAEKSTEDVAPEEESQPSFMGLITGVSGVIEKTGTKVLSSGLDTLEFLGKKTMDVLQENDPGLKNKRSLFQSSKPNLSEALREAKQKAENEDNDSQFAPEETKIHYTKLFDDFQGLVHLEALEMLSKQSEAKLPALMSTLDDDVLSSVESRLEAISTFCEMEELDDESDDEEDYDFTELANRMFKELPVAANPQKLIQAQEKSRTWLANLDEDKEKEDKPNPKELHAHALESLAEITARGVEVLHKTSELILAANQSEGSKAAEALSSIGKLICKELNVVAAKYGDAINTANDTNNADAPNNSLITEVFLEASNSNFYMRDALKLTCPVLQASLMENVLDIS